jgi:hypothetical protein
MDKVQKYNSFKARKCLTAVFQLDTLYSPMKININDE